MMKNEPRHVQKGQGETYPDVTRFDDFGSAPKDETDADLHQAARYHADCVTRQNNQNFDALRRGEPHKQSNIKQIAEDM